MKFLENTGRNHLKNCGGNKRKKEIPGGISEAFPAGTLVGNPEDFFEEI